LCAGFAPDTAILPQVNLRLERLVFRVVAPSALERASFQKDARPDSRPVMDGIALDIGVEAYAIAKQLNLGARNILCVGLLSI
jgi:hypothetical protein